jgi:DUF2075 family protein
MYTRHKIINSWRQKVVITRIFNYKDVMIGSLTSHTTSHKSVFGWKKLMKEEPLRAAAELDLIIKNTYRTLMTRGMKGCYIFSDDEETRDWFRGI